MANGNRSTMRMNWADFSAMAGDEDEAGRSANEGSGTIYYLKTSTPHEHDISISGPYKYLEAVYAQAMHNFGAECEPGKSMLQDTKVNGRVTGIEHIVSPINGDGNKTRRIQLIRKKNAALASRLPCPVWSVIKTEIATEALQNGPVGPNKDAVPVNDVQIMDSFESEAPAKDAARAVLRDMAQQRYIPREMTDSPFNAAILDGRDFKWTVQVVRDDGMVRSRG